MLLEKVVWAGVKEPSFGHALHALQQLAGLSISAQRVARAVERVGQERVAERDANVKQFQQLPIPQWHEAPPNVAVPDVAVVNMDGGRIQYRDRLRPEPSEAVEEGGRKGRFWREVKVGLLYTADGEPSQEDPCPTIPEVFVDGERLARLVQEIKGSPTSDASGSCGEKSPEVPGDSQPPQPSRVSDCPEDEGDASQNASAVADPPSMGERWSPEPVLRSVVATRRCSEEFGWMLAEAAWQRGFMAAKRRAFVADGLQQNWAIHRKHFASFVPIVDFVHAICYVYHAAMAGWPAAEAWGQYVQWAQWLWSGRVDLVIGAMRLRMEQLQALPDSGNVQQALAELAEAFRYLENNRSRMKYDEYRRLGLPITTAHIESLIKQIHRRMKGTEKFWSKRAEPLLTLTADYLSETGVMPKYWQRRHQSSTGTRHYSRAA
jgi:hypothetical protein